MNEADDTTEIEIVEYCGRLSCHKAIVQVAGRGRRREFCSDVCRRGADRDYKRAKALVEHFEQGLRRMRHEVAAYGRRAEADSGFLTPEGQADLATQAAAAMSRAEAILEFSPDGSQDRFFDELRRLVEDLRPLVASGRFRATA